MEPENGKSTMTSMKYVCRWSSFVSVIFVLMILLNVGNLKMWTIQRAPQPAPIRSVSNSSNFTQPDGGQACHLLSPENMFSDAAWAACEPLTLPKNAKNATKVLPTLLPTPPTLPPVMNATDYVELASNCDCFRRSLGYMSDNDTTADEREFPIAFSILTYENFAQTERLLRLIYRPHNFYCIHVDAKATKKMNRSAEAVARCLQNVFVASPAVSVSWGNISVVEAELLCIRQLLNYSMTWKYFINLVGRDFPLKTNAEIVAILRTYNGSNDVEGTRKNYHPEWFQYSWTWHEKGAKKAPAPHGFNITKGSTHMVAARPFVEFALRDQRAKDLFEWMRDTRVPDEHFFPTLNHNPQFQIPGSYKDDPDKKSTLARLKHWSFLTYPSPDCTGEYIRQVCNIGVGDLPWVTSARELFVNKIRLEREPLAFRCLELWYRRKALGRAGARSTLDLDFYANQSFVRKHF